MKEKVLITNLICNFLENLLMIAGIVYASVAFKRAALLWFLLLPLANSITIRFPGEQEEKENVDEQKIQ